MVRILEKKRLNKETVLFKFYLPEIAQRAQPGQFIIVRVEEEGERIPLTIADFHPEEGSVEVVVQEAGATTKLLAHKKAGEEISGVSGPLGNPVSLEEGKRVVCVGGGVGIACVYPVARAFKEKGNDLISIIGARTKGLIIFEKRMREISRRLLVATEDGSYGRKGTVVEVLREYLAKEKVDLVFVVGPAIMMQKVAMTTYPLRIPTQASLNPLMVDGTGMCGACRVKVGGKRKFACVDGPHFDAHQVDFEELIARQKSYQKEEKERLRVIGYA
ncbi:MAG: sulfide/dihydroorotate dehydrogenase-like FAD/NAD-binding protein [Candidatus Omnitrophota bacterium]|nr:MAG: sulfide/dihydroorotate dehydrogenase-like FAD/NAD-binding protein [Candidatus Omnitrophota bacterium]